MQSRLLFVGCPPQVLLKAAPVPCRVVSSGKRHGHPTTARAAGTGPNKAPVKKEAMVQAAAVALLMSAIKTQAAADAEKAAEAAKKAAEAAKKAAEAAKKAADACEQENAEAVCDLWGWGILTVVAAIFGRSLRTKSLGMVAAFQLVKAMEPFKPWSKLARVFQVGGGQ